MAARYWVNGGNGNWNSTTNWSATSGGASGASVPGASDDVYFDANGNSNSTISANINVQSVTIDSGYTATMTHNAILSIVLDWTFHSGYTIAGASQVTKSGNGTITSNGASWPNNIQMAARITQLTGDFTVLGSWTGIGNGSVVNGSDLRINGISLNGGSNGQLSGTSKIVLIGGTLGNFFGGSNQIQNALDFDGDVTLSGNIGLGSGKISYISGTISPGSSTTRISGSTIFDTNGMSFYNLYIITTSSFIELESDLTCSGTFGQNSGQNSGINTSNGSKVICNGLSFVTSSGTTFSGTAQIIINGGTWVESNVILLNDLEIRGDVNFSTVRYRQGTITDDGNPHTITGTLNVSSGDTIFDCPNLTFENITFGSFNYTLNALLSAVGEFLTGGNSNFEGTDGWICGTFTHTGISSFTVTLKEGLTYRINDLINVYFSRNGSVITFTSSSGTVKAILTLRNGALSKTLANFTRIDSSNGRTINTFSGTVTDCINVRQFFDLGTVGSAI